jgi:hypothetical protein
VRAILDFRFWILDCRAGVAGLGAVALLLSACATGPNYPDPQPGYGQILVKLNGVPKDGVGGPKRVEVRGEYSSMFESVEQGKAFERVDYDDIEDVVVVLRPVPPATLGPVNQAFVSTLTLDQSGFSHAQVPATGKMTMTMQSSLFLRIANRRDTPVTIYGYSDGDASFEIEVPANGEEQVSGISAGVYDVFCLEDESVHCRLIAEIEGNTWYGPSRHGAFFGLLPDGEYEIHVYASRLPVRVARASVTLGKRTQVSVDLTVNHLPKAE